MILAFMIDDIDKFNAWLDATKEKGKQYYISVFFEIKEHIIFDFQDHWHLVVFNLEFHIGEIMPAIWFKFFIKKALIKHGMQAKSIKLKKAWGLVLNGAI